MAKLVTIERQFLDQQRQFPGATGTFTYLMYDVALIAKLIAKETTRAGLAGILGEAGEENVQGENQQVLDVYANDTIIRMMDHTGRLCIMASEENAEPIQIPEAYPNGKYALLFDPLDGSSNIDYNVSVGTIFSIHRRVTDGTGPGTLADLLQPGYKQVAAGYVIYGSSTMLVYTTGQGVQGFTLDPGIGEFLLSHPDMHIPDTAKYYSANQGYQRFWSQGVREYVDWLTHEGSGRGSGLSLRYIGSMVADLHRTLLSGGVFFYPADTKNPELPFGKLRLTYECAPLAMIIEQAGGYASDGVGPVRAIQPHDMHQRIPWFAGNRELVEKAEEFIREHDGEWIERYQEHLQQEAVIPERENKPA